MFAPMDSFVSRELVSDPGVKAFKEILTLEIHRFGFNSFNYKWTTYTKGCASRREDNNQTASVGCFDLNIDTKSTGYTTVGASESLGTFGSL